MSNDRALQPPDVVGLAEVLKIMHISRAGFDKTHRHRPEFPPARKLAQGDVWERRAVKAYDRQRLTGKPYLQALEAFRRYRADPTIRRSGPITDTANALTAAGTPISYSTVRRYLKELGEIPR